MPLRFWQVKEIFYSPPLLIPVIDTITIKAGWRDAPVMLQALSNKQKIQFQLPLHKTFYPISPPLSHWQLKHSHKTKINKIILSASPYCFFTHNLQYQNWKANKHTVLTVIELGSPVLEPFTKISIFYVPTDSKHKFHKAGIKN